MKLKANPIYINWLWRIVVIKEARKEQCEVCGGKEVLECHHIVTRRNLWLKWVPENGLLVDRKCHNRPVKILDWLKEKYPGRYKWLMNEKRKIHRCQRIDLEQIRMNLELRI